MSPVPEDATITMTGAELIAAERQRQVSEEGYSAGHDDGFPYELHRIGDLALAAVAYVHAPLFPGQAPPGWPWDDAEFKPSSELRDLVKAGALIAAEIDRVQRRNARCALTAKAEKRVRRVKQARKGLTT